jgi:hypothetical protein
MNSPEISKEIVLGARREWLDRARILKKNFERMAPDAWLRERRDLHAVFVRARFVRPFAAFQPMADVVSTLFAGKLPHEEATELDEELTRLEASLLARGARPSPRLTDREQTIWAAIEKNPGAEGLDYCRLLDKAHIQPRKAWKDKGCPSTYVKAYGDLRWRQRINDEKSKLLRKVPELLAR